MRYETEKWIWVWGFISVFVLVIILPIWIIFNTSTGEQFKKHFWSGVSGLQRTVNFYDCSGKVIKSWTGDLNVEDKGGSIRFIADGKAVIVGGNFVVEEK